MSHWRTDQQQASRAVFVRIKNTTSFPLLRTTYGLDYGSWSQFPPGAWVSFPLLYIFNRYSYSNTFLQRRSPRMAWPNLAHTAPSWPVRNSLRRYVLSSSFDEALLISSCYETLLSSNSIRNGGICEVRGRGKREPRRVRLLVVEPLSWPEIIVGQGAQ